MPDLIARDGFDAQASAKLWALLPEVYRAADSTSVDESGPLRELLDRVAGQVAVVRRSLDRLWEDQSIESCDDWVVPYLAALLDTNLVPSMDARGQRLDVANTINYRRRKGTLGLVEQLAADVTGWECRAVEFFRELSRRRHSLDPAFGWPADAPDPAAARRLLQAQRLVGPLTGTPAGGFADLRHAAGASQTGSAFDEFHHRLDVRAGRGALGWYGVPKIGLFLWTSQSLFVDRATPVAIDGCTGHFTFDPTGRQIALWQADDRGATGYGEHWQPLEVFGVPGPLSQWVLDAFPGAPLWPGSLSVTPTGGAIPVDQDLVQVWPEVGRFVVDPVVRGTVEVGYHYGAFARIGAGPYDRRQLGTPSAPDPAPLTTVAGGSATALATALGAAGPTGTVVITDGLTSTAVADLTAIDDLCVRAAEERRAVIRLAATDAPWIFDGATSATGDGASLRLEGLLVSGQDIILRGRFDEVVLSCCTLDPGTSGELREPPVLWEPSVDGRDLRPTRLIIEGSVGCLMLDRCITGPVRTRIGGVVERVSVRDSVVQGLPSSTSATLTPEQLFDGDGLVSLLHHARDPLTTWLAAQLSASAKAVVDAFTDGATVSPSALAKVVSSLNTVIGGPLVYDAARFAGRELSSDALAQIAAAPTGPALAALNRQLFAEAFPLALADAAIALHTGLTRIERSTVLGRTFVHRLECSESILDDVAIAGDAQDGCVRFSAWATGSRIPRKYESVRVAAGAALFTSRRFGEAGFAQLARGADAAILGSTTAGTPSLREGGADSTEIGAGSRDSAARRERSLLIKLDEYLPVGLTPVLIPMPPADADGETMRGRTWPPM